jgi:lipopolysaccharide export system protein LptA
MQRATRIIRLVLSVASLSAAVAIVASRGAAQQGASFKDHAGNMQVTGLRSFRIESSGHFVGIAAGDKIHATWKKQALKVDCSKIEGNVGGSSDKGYVLQKATMGGGVQAVATRPSSNAQSNQTQTSRITGETATYVASQELLHVTGGVDVHSQDPGASQTLHAVGSSGDLILSGPAAATRAVRSATLEGPVTLDMSGTRLTSEEGKAPQRIPFTMHGLADRMMFDDVTRTVTMIGHVRITGDDPTIGGDVVADKEVLYLNADGSVSSVELEGDPGKTVYRDKKAGGSRR